MPDPALSYFRAFNKTESSGTVDGNTPPPFLNKLTVGRVVGLCAQLAPVLQLLNDLAQVLDAALVVRVDGDQGLHWIARIQRGLDSCLGTTALMVYISYETADEI